MDCLEIISRRSMYCEECAKDRRNESHRKAMQKQGNKLKKLKKEMGKERYEKEVRRNTFCKSTGMTRERYLELKEMMGL